MKRTTYIVAVALALGGVGILSAVAFPSVAARSASTQVAAVRTIVFAIGNMTCASCPITVRLAMERVEGVQSVKVDFEAKTATVVFDPSVTTVEAIAAASTNVGYPATPAS